MSATFKVNTKEELESFVTSNWDEINAHIDSELAKLPTSLYTSCDIRESKDKFAPVDLNIYPAGFNNLCMLDLEASGKLFKRAFDKVNQQARHIAIIPESHTKNKFYLDHLAILGRAIRDAGYEVSFMSLDESLFSESETLDLVSHSGFDLRIEKALIKDGKFELSAGGVDIAVLNNDQSSPLPVNWGEIKTPVLPTPHIGWFARQKNIHFSYYKQVADAFCERYSIKPDLIQARFKAIENVDFETKSGLEPLGAAVDELIHEIGVGRKVFVKASQGTYGMGISVVGSGEEIISMNRKVRNKMDVGKNKIKFTSLLVQEGVETILKYDDAPAEVTIYLVDGQSVGGFMRANSERDSEGNLNSKGMVFRKFCISEIRQNQDHQCKEAVYSVIARLSTLASSHEIKDVL